MPGTGSIPGFRTCRGRAWPVRRPRPAVAHCLAASSRRPGRRNRCVRSGRSAGSRLSPPVPRRRPHSPLLWRPVREKLRPTLQSVTDDNRFKAKSGGRGRAAGVPTKIWRSFHAPVIPWPHVPEHPPRRRNAALANRRPSSTDRWCQRPRSGAAWCRRRSARTRRQRHRIRRRAVHVTQVPGTAPRCWLPLPRRRANRAPGARPAAPARPSPVALIPAPPSRRSAAPRRRR